MEHEDFVSVHTLTNRFEADLLEDALQREQVPVIVRTYEETPYDGLFVSQKGWGMILVPRDCEDQAKAIIEPLVEELRTKKLYENPNDIDPLLWTDLQATDPDQVCRRALVRYDTFRGGYLVPVLNGLLCCVPSRQTVEMIEPLSDPRVDFQLTLVVLHYLFDARPSELRGRWIGEKDLPGGSLFFQGPHAFPTGRLLEIFHADPNAFHTAMKRLDGVAVDAGDSAYRLWMFPRIPILVIFWQGDDEFEPELHFRFDASITDHLQVLDTIWALVNILCRNILAAALGVPVPAVS